MRFIALDASLTNTGYAIYEVSTRNFEFQLLTFGQIETGKMVSLDTRVRLILKQLSLLEKQYDLHCYYVEEPVLALFGNHSASSILPLFAVVYGIVGFCHSSGSYIRLLHAQTWQQNEAKNLKIDSKIWTVRKANELLTYLKFSKQFKPKEHNQADAVNIGVYCIRQLKSGSWVLPNTGNPAR